MNISLDYDGTYTEDPAMWNRIIATMRNADHTVMVITMRTPGEGAEVEANLRDRVDAIHYTSRAFKFKFCSDNNVKVDVWIDDAPYFITG